MIMSSWNVAIIYGILPLSCGAAHEITTVEEDSTLRTTS